MYPRPRAVGFQLVGNFQLLQLLNNALCFLRIEIGLERLILDTIDEINEHPKQDQNQSARTGQSQFLLKGVAGEERLDLFERIWSSHSRLPILRIRLEISLIPGTPGQSCCAPAS